MEEDKELQAMIGIRRLLSDLEPEAIVRVLRWAADRFQVPAAVSGNGRTKGGSGPTSEMSSDFENFASFYDAANPQSAIENALVAAYWVQEVQGEDDFEAMAVNRELKHLGYPSTNITRDLDALINRSPRLVLQVRKSGSTRQARKKYKVTTEGKRAVERMLAGTPLGSE